MANNYLQFSFKVFLAELSCEEWARNLLSAADFGKDASASEPDEETQAEFQLTFPLFEDLGDLGFSWDLTDGELWIYAEENGETEHVVKFLQSLVMREDFAQDKVGFTYACWCSAMRPDEFSGGAIVVSNKEGEAQVAYVDATDWMHMELLD